MYGVALRITREAGLASDAVQEALLQVWKNAARFDHTRGTPESWLLGLVRYRALDIARRQSRESPSDSLPERMDEGPDALAVLMTSSDGAALGNCLRQLNPDRQKLIIMAFTEGLSHSELAARLGEPLGTIKSWIRRALTALRTCLTA
jgi:RNA polymerase sigma-70 factor (ECF subfamily)